MMKKLLFSSLFFAISASALAKQPIQPNDHCNKVSAFIYFGLPMPDGSSVTPSQWDHFLKTQVTSRFPDGLTVFDGNGQWKGSNDIPTKVINIVYDGHDKKQAEEKIKAFSLYYKKMFKQQSVMEVISPACWNFY